MKAICTLTKRNMMLFFQSPTSVFFSFMAVFVVLFLYICFLGDMMIEPLKQSFPDTAREISDTWIMAGTLGIVSLTTSLSVLGIVIEDKSNHQVDDFYVAPISSLQLTMAYMISTLLITMIISYVTLAIAEIYIIAYGGAMMSMACLLKVSGVMLLSICCCTSMLYFVMSFFQSATSFSNVTTIIGTLSGFLMGIYVPVGSLPGFLQTIIAWFPPSHGAALLRDIMMENVLQASFPAEASDALESFKQQFGLTFAYGDHICSNIEHLLILIAMGVVFFLFNMLRKQRK